MIFNDRLKNAERKEHFMSEDKRPIPPIQVVMFVGHGGEQNSPQKIDKIRRKAEQTGSSFYLPSRAAHSQRYEKVQRYYVVREEQKDIYSSETLDLDGYEQIVMPDKNARYASDRREWVRTNLAMKSNELRLCIDADFNQAALNVLYQGGKCDPLFSDPDAMTSLLGPFFLLVQHYQIHFAGFRCDRFNRPSCVPGAYLSYKTMQEGIQYFKECCTIESADCPGKYPLGWDFHEGGYRILDTARKGGKIAIFGPSIVFETRPAETYERVKNEYVKLLCKEFGEKRVLGRSEGLGLKKYGQDRNKKRKGD